MSDPNQSVWRRDNLRLELPREEEYLVAWRGRELRLFYWGLARMMGLPGALTFDGAVRKAVAWLTAGPVPSPRLGRAVDVATEAA